MSRGEKEKGEAETRSLNSTVASQQEEIDGLRAEKEELERLSRMTDDDLKRSLREKVLDLQNKLQRASLGLEGRGERATGSGPTSGIFTDQINRTWNARRGGKGVHGPDTPRFQSRFAGMDGPRDQFSRLESSWVTGGPSQTSRPHIQSFVDGKDITYTTNSTHRPPVPAAPPFIGENRSLPPLRQQSVEMGGGDFINNISKSGSEGITRKTRPPSAVFSPTHGSCPVSSYSVPSATDADAGPVLDENSEYWRSGHKECELVWAEIQGLQEGLRAHGVDVTKNKWLGETIEYMDAARVDGLTRSKGSSSSLVET
ncbi:hypothetical protein ONS95_011730 [Cadophora gregata]|uniref:uncharacterized protein n=1 Tax=Cadophora gregata TaxID=51156 RepID=UPI0026DD3ADC|nr:uncharacterized protein ONS95_011730 [Cadophora gregata]KAK0120324.1 hypothetical protein ONS95_011730 [Cadophora gregata]KAK0121357.1 hypothetical protein ONS96_011531 [Cadophora gregata f. sp. sojae]